MTCIFYIGSNKYFNDGVGADEYKLNPRLLAVHGLEEEDLVDIGSKLVASISEYLDKTKNAMTDSKDDIKVPAIETLSVVPSRDSPAYKALAAAMEDGFLTKAQLLNVCYFLVVQIPLHNTEATGIRGRKQDDTSDVTDHLKRMNFLSSRGGKK